MSAEGIVRLRSSWPIAWVIAISVLGFWGGIAIVGSAIAPHDPTEFVSETPFLQPSSVAWLGTDYLGRDLLSRLLDATRVTLGMAFAATLISHLLGVTTGLLAAALGRWVDALLSRLIDVLLSLPKIVVGLVVVAALGPRVHVIVVVTGVVYAASVFRIARALGNDLITAEFVRLSQARGEGLAWIMFQEILPHIHRPLLADFAIRMSFAILFMSSLSFLGLGVQPPDADWGGLVKENISGLSGGSLVCIFPALAIASVSIALNLLVDIFSQRIDLAYKE